MQRGIEKRIEPKHPPRFDHKIPIGQTLSRRPDIELGEKTQPPPQRRDRERDQCKGDGPMGGKMAELGKRIEAELVLPISEDQI